MELLLIVAVVVLALMIVQRRQRRKARFRYLAEHGVVVAAVVVRRIRQSMPRMGKRHILEYRFGTDGQGEVLAKAQVPAALYQTVDIGDLLPVVYDARAPEQNWPQAVVLRNLGK